jgi:hypothetical protein
MEAKIMKKKKKKKNLPKNLCKIFWLKKSILHIYVNLQSQEQK